MLQKTIYNAAMFDVANLDEAKRIILTPEDGRTTDERWARETPYLVDLIAKNLELSSDSVVVDYGSGVGRLAKELIDRFGCRVVGVDISAKMRALSENYVAAERFTPCPPDAIDIFGDGFADVCIAVWALQHCSRLDRDIERIVRALKAKGRLFVVNEVVRCIPTNRGWMSDGLDVRQTLLSHFDLVTNGHLDPEIVTQNTSQRTFWAVYELDKGRSKANGTANSIVSLNASDVRSTLGSENTQTSSSETSSPDAASTQVSVAEKKRSYPAPAEVPTQIRPNGVRFDFNDGCRVTLPEGKHPWHVRISDLDTGNILYETAIKSGRVNSTKRYFARFRLDVWTEGAIVFSHEYDAADREVLIQFPVGTLGDTIAWFPYAVKFQERHGCRLTCAMAAHLIPLFRDAYPDIRFATHQQVQPERYYATYRMGLFFDDDDHVHQPCDFRQVGLHRTAGYILGVDPSEDRPRIALSDDSRPIPEPYVCIATQSTTQAKYWNNPNGWREIVKFLVGARYRVICIDQKPVHGFGVVWNQIPHGAEDQTGDKPLLERARWIKHAEFFVGLSSGLSWLAWSVGTPVVLISGFTHPTNEFETPYRVINYHACNSCWNDVRHRFDHKDFLWCPRHHNGPRQFECTRLITADQVKAVLEAIPGFKGSRPAATRV